jgi:hypothetical protein
MVVKDNPIDKDGPVLSVYPALSSVSDSDNLLSASIIVDTGLL